MTMSETISDELLGKMLAGLEGVTPGPWFEGDHWVFVSPASGEARHPLENILADVKPQANAAHVARCDPDTMRALIALASQALRSRGEAVAWEVVFPGQPAFATNVPGIVRYCIDSGGTSAPLYTHPAPQEAGDVKVKPLVWRDNSGSRNATAKCSDTPFGLYDYSKYGANWAVYGQGTLIAEPEDEAGCIAAAQADFDARILSTLTEGSSR